jgi:hypothetical protein
MPQTAIKPTEFQIPVVQVASFTEFMSAMRRDAPYVRHREVRWIASPVRELYGRQVTFKEMTMGYVKERDGLLTLVELRRLCGTTADDSRSEEIYAERAVANTTLTLKRAARASQLRLRPGRFDVLPSPLIPTVPDLLRAFCVHFTSSAGTVYRPWSDGWSVGLECVRSDGLRTYLYLDPAQEDEDGRARAYLHLGTGGDPTEDVAQHTYDAFDAEQLARVYTVVTASGERDWPAEDSDDARRQHEEAFGDDPRERIEDVHLTRSREQTAALPAIHIDTRASEEAILDGMMRVAQRLSCRHPQSPYIEVIAALRRVEELMGA